MIEIICRGLLFDLDGVLIDSTPAVTRVWTQWAKEHGFDSDELVRRAHGRPSIETIREYLPHANTEAENEKVEHGEIHDVKGVVALPGARKLLEVLSPERWAIVTSCTRALAEVRLRAADLPLPARITTSNDVVKGKPDPEPYLKGAKALGLPPAECVVLEDAPAGIRAGKAAGARVIAFTTTFPREELQQTGADWIVEGCQSIAINGVGKSDELTLVLGDEN